MGCECGDVNCNCQKSCCCPVDRCSCDRCCNIRDHCCLFCRSSCEQGGQDVCDCCEIIAAMIPPYASNSPTHQEPEVKDEAPVRKEKCSLEEFFNEGEKKWEEDYTHILPAKTNLSFSSDEDILETNIIKNPEVPVQEVTDTTPISQFTALTEGQTWENSNECLQGNHEKMITLSSAELASDVLQSYNSKDKDFSLTEASTVLYEESASVTKEIQTQKPKEEFLDTSAVKSNGTNIIQMPKCKDIQTYSIQQENRISTSSQAESNSFSILSAVNASNISQTRSSAPDREAHSERRHLLLINAKHSPEAALEGNLKKTKKSAVKPAKTKDEEPIDQARPQHNSLIIQEESGDDVKTFKRKKSTPSPAGSPNYFRSPPMSGFQKIRLQRFLNQPPIYVTNPTMWHASIQNWVDSSDPGAGSGEEQESDLISSSLKTEEQNIEGRLTGAKKTSPEYCIRKQSLAEKELTTQAKSDNNNMTCALNLYENSSSVKKIKNRRESNMFMTRDILTGDLPFEAEIVPKETSRVALPTIDFEQESSATNNESEGKHDFEQESSATNNESEAKQTEVLQTINQSGELEHDV